MNARPSSIEKNVPPWLRRLRLPAYHVKDAARYAGVSTKTILSWQKSDASASALISPREAGFSLSYLQLIEIAVVAAMRSAGVSLSAIRAARDYMSNRLRTEYPFASHGFKTDGKNILMNLSEFDQGASSDKLIVVSKAGQLGWKPILEEKLREFDYNKNTGIAEKWRLTGATSPVLIDPQVSFGAPTIKGIATWTIRGRLDAGESLVAIAEDFSLTKSDVVHALEFEGVDMQNIVSTTAWNH